LGGKIPYYLIAEREKKKKRVSFFSRNQNKIIGVCVYRFVVEQKREINAKNLSG